ncbi:MAG: hypothetical protein DMG88_23125 [Acidobacteria bacterium]|nr:MAG: hypothetical protein DMG88_23125 [Acidobacteriota bacterium]
MLAQPEFVTEFMVKRVRFYPLDGRGLRSTGYGDRDGLGGHGQIEISGFELNEPSEVWIIHAMVKLLLTGVCLL